MQNVKQLVQRLQDVKENNATLSSGTFDFGPPPEFGASEEITYPFTGSWLNNSQLNGNILSVSFKLYFADRVNPEKNNRTEVLSALHISAIQFIAQLEYTLKYSYNSRITQSTPLVDFDERWDDEVTGWECDLTIEQYYNKSVCDIPSSGNDAGVVKIYDQNNTLWYTLNPGSMLILNNLTFTTETYTLSGNTQATTQTPAAVAGVSVNGQDTSDYTLAGSTFTFAYAVAGDEVIIKYAY